MSPPAADTSSPSPDTVADALRTVTLESADGGHCALACVPPPSATAPRGEVLMLPGMFSDRSFWRSPKGVGLAPYLAEAGLRCWLLERRGIGAAAGQQAARCGLEEAAADDLAAAWQHIRSQASGPCFLLGHSFGGVLALRALTGGRDGDGRDREPALAPEDCAGLVTLAAQCELGKSPLKPPGAWLTRLIVLTLGHLPARLAGLGSCDEPRQAVLDAIRWTTGAHRGSGWVTQLPRLPMPQLAISSAGDSVDPAEGCERLARRVAGADSRYICLSRADGWAEDYSHAGMVVSRNARAEVWPLIRDWLLARCA